MRFKDVAYKDLEPRIAQGGSLASVPHAALNEFYYSWGAAAADINKDGVPDIAAGPYYYLGPDYTTRERSTRRRPTPARSINGVQFAYDFTGDGWPDLTNRSSRSHGTVRQSPRRATSLEITTVTDAQSEIAILKDIDGDGRQE